MTSATSSTSIPFQDAIALTQSLLYRMAAEELKGDELQAAIAALVKTFRFDILMNVCQEVLG